MAKLPLYLPEVPQKPQPGIRVPRPVPGMFGEGIAKGLNSAARAAQGIYAHEMRLAEAARKAKIHKDLQGKITEWESAIDEQVVGEEAPKAAAALQDRVEADLDAMRPDDLPRDLQPWYDALTSEARARVRRRINSRVVAESRRAAHANAVSTIDSVVRRGPRSYSDPALVQADLAAIGEALGADARLNGWSNKVLDAELTKAHGAYYAGAVRAALDNHDLARAKELLAEAGDSLTPQARADLQARLRRQTASAEATGAAHEILARHIDPETGNVDRLGAMREVQKKFGDDPDKLRLAQTALSTLISAADRDRSSRQATTFLRIREALGKKPGEPGYRSFDSITPREWAEMGARNEAFLRSRFDPANRKLPPEAKQALRDAQRTEAWKWISHLQDLALHDPNYFADMPQEEVNAWLEFLSGSATAQQKFMKMVTDAREQRDEAARAAKVAEYKAQDKELFRAAQRFGLLGPGDYSMAQLKYSDDAMRRFLDFREYVEDHMDKALQRKIRETGDPDAKLTPQEKDEIFAAAALRVPVSWSWFADTPEAFPEDQYKEVRPGIPLEPLKIALATGNLDAEISIEDIPPAVRQVLEDFKKSPGHAWASAAEEESVEDLYLRYLMGDPAMKEVVDTMPERPVPLEQRGVLGYFRWKGAEVSFSPDSAAAVRQRKRQNLRRALHKPLRDARAPLPGDSVLDAVGDTLPRLSYALAEQEQIIEMLKDAGVTFKGPVTKKQVAEAIGRLLSSPRVADRRNGIYIQLRFQSASKRAERYAKQLAAIFRQSGLVTDELLEAGLRLPLMSATGEIYPTKFDLTPFLKERTP